ncbi:chromate transporter [Paenibacillus phyllosphaerae]|uniref:Chromate transporter n=1 Tax=Paenibacillus phyllosphaerae TaxID=274593 RepID=A0A7W5FQQ1_9BACL|nr:chromate transporter [Paenibacillus phyllosphaerae]MBB3113264.1 chromate transporter [Paenibacillus phyllosphaerae]
MKLVHMEKEHERHYAALSWAMFKTGVLGYGGGPSVIPLIRYEAVTRYRWLGDDEFAEILALANALPGPIATKMAAYLGYRKQGTLGAVVAVLAHIMPSAIAMVALLSAVNYLRDNPIIQGMIAAVIPVIAVMLGVMAYEFAQRAVKGLGKYAGFGFFLIAFLLLQVIDIQDAVAIALFLGYGAVHFKLLAWWKQRKTKGKGERVNETGGGE